MTELELIVKIIENPQIPRYYRELHVHYNKKGQKNEAEAIKQLMKHKFHEEFNNNSDSTQQSSVS